MSTVQRPRCSHGVIGYCRYCDLAGNSKCIHDNTGFCEWCFKNIQDETDAHCLLRGENLPPSSPNFRGKRFAS